MAQQRPALVNKGMLTIYPETKVSSLLHFENHKDATLNNDGSMYFYADFQNDGLYTFKRKTSYAVFQPFQGGVENQNLNGSAPSYFYDVLFNDENLVWGFNLKNDISIAGTANFMRGIVEVDSVYGAVVFEKGARHINTSDRSHIHGKVEQVQLSKDGFTFPIGDGSYYRPAKITTEKQLEGNFLSQYHFKKLHLNRTSKTRATDMIDTVNDKEYWTVERVGEDANVVLTLNWHEKTTPAELLEFKTYDLHIVRWDSRLKVWVDEGGIVDKEAKTVTTPAVLSEYGIFTLASIKKMDIEDDVVIYNAVSANGDGHNDYFKIKNIQKFPNNTVQIFNRWGVKVYDTENYDSRGNVFKGISEGRISVQKSEKLPSGTYYYILNYEHIDVSGSRMIKKSGYLHLDGN